MKTALKKWEKYLLYCVMPLVLILLTAGCSTPIKSEQDIIADLQTSELFISGTVEICNYEIIKRQTSIDDKEDIVYLTVYTNEPELACELSYIMQYILYNDGWILENIERYYDGPWSIEGLSRAKIVEDIWSADTFIKDYEARYGPLPTDNWSITEELYGDYSMYGKGIHVVYDGSDSRINYYAEYYIEYVISEGQWMCMSVWTDTSYYEPNFSPSVEATDKIMDTLPYESYEYLWTEEDWANCAQTVHYSATRQYALGAETYEVSIPLHFSVNDESSMWTYNDRLIKEIFQTAQFDIQGAWSARGESYNDEYDIYLEVGEIAATDDSDVFSVKAMSDSIYKDIAFIELNRYYCITDSYVDGTISREGEGRYTLEVESVLEGEGVNGKGQKTGVFSIVLGGSTQEDGGLWWAGGGGTIKLSRQ